MRLRSHRRPTMPRLVRAGALIALCGVLGGCASGTSSSGRARVTGAALRPGASPTHAQALAFARAVNLTAADVPGFTASSRHQAETQREKRLQRQLRQCTGPVHFGDGLAGEQSAPFELKRDILDLGVSSEVAVARTRALAAGELAAIRGGRVKECFSRYLHTLLKVQRDGVARPGPVSIASGTPPAPGADGSYGWRIIATFTANRIRLSLYVDILGFVLGPARVTLVSSGALRPFPAELQQRLYTLLLARAKARAL
jgi:hypothetical protein